MNNNHPDAQTLKALLAHKLDVVELDMASPTRVRLAPDVYARHNIRSELTKLINMDLSRTDPVMLSRINDVTGSSFPLYC